MSAVDIIGEITQHWFLHEPLLFNCFCTHKLEENLNLLSMFRTGQQKIQYNPNLVENASVRKVESLLKVEVLRIILKHPYSRVPEFPVYSALTVTSDVTIQENVEGLNAGLKDAAFYNLDSSLSYEEYYSKLKLMCPDNHEMADALSDFMNQMENNESHSGNQSGNGKGTASSKGNTKDMTGSYEAAAQASELWENDEQMTDRINTQIENAQKSNQWGSLSGNAINSILASLKIPMDYRKILSNFHSSIVSSRRKLTRMKPNRRYGYQYMGSEYEPKTKILVAIDDSGSVEESDLEKFFSIINRFFSYGVEKIDVITFDTTIHDVFELKKAKKNIKITGRGGTDFQCAINYYEEKTEYQGMIIFTDGYAPVPKIIKRKKILWILTSLKEYENSKDWISEKPYWKSTYIPDVSKKPKNSSKDIQSKRI